MKKVLATILALSTVATMGITAFAAPITTDTEITLPVSSIFNDKGVALTNETQTPNQKFYVGVDITELTTDKNHLGDVIDDGKLLKLKLEKGDDNSKMIESVKLVQKVLGSRARQYYVEVKVKDDMTDKEYKISPSFTLTAKKDLVNDNDVIREATAAEITGNNYVIKNGTDVTYNASLWISNTKNETDDETYAAGKGGVYVKPVKNEENSIIWEDENEDLASLTFDADSSVKTYFPKLSTKWDNSRYAEDFADQDAFIRSFVGTPEISSTSRAVLQLYIPYVDEDDELTVSEEDIIVYQDVDGELVDITAKGQFVTNDDDQLVFEIKTRQLGTYIFATAPVGEVADEPTEEPTEDEAVKGNPGTGF